MLFMSRATQAIIVEVLLHFSTITGQREGQPGVKPYHVKCIDISTSSSIREMVLPGVFSIVSKLIAGFCFRHKSLVLLLWYFLFLRLGSLLPLYAPFLYLSSRIAVIYTSFLPHFSFSRPLTPLSIFCRINTLRPIAIIKTFTILLNYY